MAGGTYNLQLFDEDGTVNELGDAYIRGCQKWARASKSKTDADASPIEAEVTGQETRTAILMK